MQERSLATDTNHRVKLTHIGDSQSCESLNLWRPVGGQGHGCSNRMAVFARLIQRSEPRNMIRTMFLGKQAADKVRRVGGTEPMVETALV